MRKWPTTILAGIALGSTFLLVQTRVTAETRVNYFNGVPYVFPATTGAAGKVLTNDGAGNLSWASPATVSSLWSGAIVASTIACPDGFTRLTGADNRFLRAVASGAGSTGGSDTHTHTTSGSTGSSAVTISGSTAGSTVSISGTTASASISHNHSTTQTTSACASGSNTVLYSLSINNTDPSHSHGVGTLGGGSHTHGVGTLAGGSHTHDAGTLAATASSNVPAWYGLILCVKD